MDAPAPKRFAHFSDEELKNKAEAVQKKNTLRNEDKAVRALKAYLNEIGAESDDFFTFTESELDSHLTKFWFSLRKQKKANGDTFYRVSSIYTLRHSLNRALKRYGHNYDITRKECISFTKSIKSFEDAIAELKKNGLGYVSNTKEITQKGNFWLR